MIYARFKYYVKKYNLPLEISMFSSVFLFGVSLVYCLGLILTKKEKYKGAYRFIHLYNHSLTYNNELSQK